MSDNKLSDIFAHYGISLMSESSLEGLVIAFGLFSGVSQFACIHFDILKWIHLAKYFAFIGYFLKKVLILCHRV